MYYNFYGHILEFISKCFVNIRKNSGLLSISETKNSDKNIKPDEIKHTATAQEKKN